MQSPSQLRREVYELHVQVLPLVLAFSTKGDKTLAARLTPQGPQAGGGTPARGGTWCGKLRQGREGRMGAAMP